MKIRLKEPRGMICMQGMDYQYALEFNRAINKQLLILSQPLILNFPFTHFGYLKIYKDGAYITLNHNLDWMEVYYKNSFIDTSAFFLNELEPASTKRLYTSLWPTEPPCKQDALLSALYDHDMWHGLNVQLDHPDHIEIWCFMTHKENDLVNSIYLNEMDKLKAFIYYFAEKFKPMLDQCDKKKLCVSLSHRKFFEDHSTHAPQSTNFIKSVQLKKYHFSGASGTCTFTRREFECVLQLANGKSAKEIALFLGLSYRTVEAYLENVRVKLDCHTKNQIMETLLKDPMFDLILKV